MQADDFKMPSLAGPETFSTLVESLQYHAQATPCRAAYTFLSEAGEETFDFRALDLRAKTIAAKLQSLNITGGRALLLYPPGLEYIAAFMGCLYAGVVAVPAYPPQNLQSRRSLPRLRAILHDSRPATVLTIDSLSEICRGLLGHAGVEGATHLVATDRLAEACASAWKPPRITADALAFLQYTSGSTATPKGVMVTHSNLISNEEMIRDAFLHTEESVVVGWLPLYHDMGLIGNVLQPLFCGIRCVLMSPASFLQRPARWLAAISKYRATTSGGPNFAYQLCADKILPEEKAGLDLSSWKIAYNGAEPVRANTLQRFSEAFRACGFREESFYPCYGLAEATLFVSGGGALRAPVVKAVDAGALGKRRVQTAAAPEKARWLVSCGRSVPPQKVAIVDPDTMSECPSGCVGEIWVCGPGAAAGYWNRPEESNAVFGAHTVSPPSGPYLRTGDLGFLLDNELYVAGRLKDLIIIRGRNHYPQDIEWTAERSHPFLRPGGGAAFSVDVEGEERLVIAHEIERQHRNGDLVPVASAIREAVAEQHEVAVHALVLLKPGAIPKTSSGKIQRHLCRTAFLEEQFEPLLADKFAAKDPQVPGSSIPSAEAIFSAPAEERSPLLLDYMLRQVAEVLRIPREQVAAEKSILAHGLDSVGVIELTTRIENDLGVAIDMATVLQAPAIRSLASNLETRLQPSNCARTDFCRKGKLAGNFGDGHRASPEQEALWLLDQRLKSTAAYNILVPVRLHGVLKTSALEKALFELVKRHEILRSQYQVVNEHLMQLVRPATPLELCVEDLESAAEPDAELRRRSARDARKPFDLCKGPVLRVRLYRLSAEQHVLTLVLHHIAADGWSVQLLLREMAELYSACLQDGMPALRESVQYAEFASRRGASDAVWKAQLEYWRRQLAGAPEESFLPVESTQPGAPEEESVSHEFHIPERLVSVLKVLCRAEEASPFVLLLAAFKALFMRMSGLRDLVVGSSVANRNNAYECQIVGPLTNAVALRTRLPDGKLTFQELAKHVRSTVVEALQNHEVPFSQIASQLGIARKREHRPLFDAVFLFQNFLKSGWQMGDLNAELEEFDTGASPFPVALLVYEKGAEWVGVLRLQTALFKSEMACDIAASYLSVLEQISANPALPLTDLKLSERLEHQTVEARHRHSRCLAVAATFTAELLEEPLAFWMRKLNLQTRIEFAPYHQVLQQLLDPQSVLSRNCDGINVVLLRLQDWERNGWHDESLAAFEKRLNHLTADLVAAVQASAARSPIPHLVVLCPAAPGSVPPERKMFYESAEASLLAELKETPGVYIVSWEEALRPYPVAEIHDRCADEVGHVPFTGEFFTALATGVARYVRALSAAAYKAIVLDCDQTLWSGICGEDGVSGVRIEGPWLALQNFMIERQKAGMLLCLCSKNEERDVLAVFEQRADMALRLEHTAARKINWNDKPANLLALSRELGLSLESMIFVDDNPIECAAVRAAYPAVFVLELPQDPGLFPEILQHTWAFDRPRVTEEDKRRTRVYQQNAQRSDFSREHKGLEDFLAGLQLECEIRPPHREEVSRVAQLLQRTTQFNTTSLRCSESELENLRLSEIPRCLAVRAKDRFGDYGLIGAMIIQASGGVLHVESFVLSCRAFGRRIEHRMVAVLGDLAQRLKLNELAFSFQKTERNRPAFDFLQSLPEMRCASGVKSASFHVPAAAALRAEQCAAVAPVSVGTVVSNAHNHFLDAEAIVDIAKRLRRVRDIEIEINAHPRSRVSKPARALPTTPTEQMLAQIWSGVLRQDGIGIQDNFFELGGHSLQGTVVVSRIRQAFGVEMPLHVILEQPTIAQIAAWLEQQMILQLDEGELKAALSDLDAFSEEEVKALLAGAVAAARAESSSERGAGLFLDDVQTPSLQSSHSTKPMAM